MVILQSFSGLINDLDIGKLLDINNLSDLFNLLINTAFILGLAGALIFVIISGIKYTTSSGDPNKAQEARGTLTNAIIGAIIIVSFMALANIVLALIGAPNITTILTSP